MLTKLISHLGHTHNTTSKTALTMYENSDLTLQELTKWKATNLLLNYTTHLHRNTHVSVITLVGHDISFSVSLAFARDEPRALNTILPLNFISSLAMIPKTNKTTRTILIL